jgi:hypothetical protein
MYNAGHFAVAVRGCLQNGCTRQYSVEIGLKMLIYYCKLRFFDRFRLVLPSFAYFVNTL